MRTSKIGTYLVQSMVYVLALALGAALLANSAANLRSEFTMQLSAAWTDIAVITGALLLAVIHARLAIALAVTLFVGYCSYFGFLYHLGKSLLFVLLTGYSCYALALHIIRKSSAFEENHPEQLVPYIWTLFLTLITLLSIILLTAQAQYRSSLFLIAAVIFFLTLKLHPSSDWKKLLLQPFRSIAVAYRSAAENRAEGVLSFSLLVITLLYAIGYFSVVALAGDARHAYLAVPRAYAADNSILLTDPSYTWNPSFRLFHLQELILSVGYTLDQRLGARFFGLLLILGKLQVLYALARHTFELSRQHAKFLVIAFTLVPLIFEIQLGVRPDNLMSFVLLILLYFLEEAFRSSNERSLRPAFLVTCVWLTALLASTKLTAGLVIPLLPLLYFPLLIRSLRSVGNLKAPHWAAIMVSASLAGWWWIRNFFFFGQPMLEKTSGSILTGFPPVRDFTALANFLTEGLTHTSRYTEFADFGYGVWGILLLPLVLIALTERPLVRRFALLFLLYSALLLNFGTQIRYLAPLVPCAFLAIFGSSWVSTAASWMQRRNILASCLTTLAVILLAASVAIACRGVPGRRSSAYYTIAKRVIGQRTDVSTVEPWKTLNAYLSSADRIMAGGIVYMYDIEGKLHVTRNLRGFAHLLREYQEQGVGYFVEFPYAMGSIDNPFFNDHKFLETVGQLVAEAGLAENLNRKTRLYKINSKTLARIGEYIKSRNWPEKNVFVVSDEIAAKFVSSHVVGEPLCIADLKHRLFRLYGIWLGSPTKYLNFSKDKTPHGSCVVQPKEQNIRCEGALFAAFNSADNLALNVSTSDTQNIKLNIAYSVVGRWNSYSTNRIQHPEDDPLELDLKTLSGDERSIAKLEEIRVTAFPSHQECS